MTEAILERFKDYYYQDKKEWNDIYKFLESFRKCPFCNKLMKEFYYSHSGEMIKKFDDSEFIYYSCDICGILYDKNFKLWFIGNTIYGIVENRGFKTPKELNEFQTKSPKCPYCVDNKCLSQFIRIEINKVEQIRSCNGLFFQNCASFLLKSINDEFLK